MDREKVLRRGNKCYHNVVSELNRFAAGGNHSGLILFALLTIKLVMLLNMIMMMIFDRHLNSFRRTQILM